MPDTSAGADDVARLAMWPSPRVIPRGDSFVGPKSGCRGPRDARGERLSRARGFPGAQSEKQVNTVPLPICVSSHAKASFERENGGFSVEKTTRQRRGNPKLFAVFFRVIRATEILRARFFATTTDDLFLFPFSRTVSQHFNECASTRRRLSARRVHIHTATSTTLNRFNNRKAQQRTNFNSSNSATERSANNPTGDSLSSARRDLSASRRAPRALKTNTKTKDAYRFFGGGPTSV